MQTTSATWKQLWAAGAPLEARATIAGTVYTEISAPVIHRAAMQERLSVGNVAAASLTLGVRSAAAIPRSAAVVIEARLNDGATASEWLPQGTFYISRRARDPVTGTVALDCYDALLKANAVWTPSQGSWPRTMAAVAAELLALLGLQMDSRTAIPSGAAFAMNEPAAGTTIRDVLGMIAQAGGGNWIVTPAGKLRLVPIADAADAGEAAADALDVPGVTGAMDAGPAGTITGVRCTVDGEVTLTGDDSGIVVDVSVAPMIAVEAADLLIGREYQAYRLTGAICDPAAELGDFVRAGANGEIRSALYSQQIALGPACRSEIAAPEAGELTDEYPYIGSDAKALALAKAYADQAVDELDGDLTQQEIFDRLTDNGAAQGLVLYNGQLYVNASYIQAGTLTLGGLNNVNGQLRVLDASGNEVGKWTKDGIETIKGTLGEWTIDSHGLSKVSSSGPYDWDISITPNGVRYKSIHLPGIHDNVSQTLLDYSHIALSKKLGNLMWSNSEIYGEAENSTGASVLKLIASGQYYGDATDIQLTSKDHSDGGQLTVNAKLNVTGNTTFSGTVAASAFSGPLTGNVTGNCTGNAANVTGTVAVGHGGTDATTAEGARTNLGTYMILNASSIANLFAKLDVISINETVPIRITVATTNMLMNKTDEVSNVCSGIVTRLGTNNFKFLVSPADGECIYAWRVSPLSATTLTAGRIYKYSGTAI